MQDPPRSDDPMILLDEVRLTLTSAAGPVNVLRGVSLRVGAGETVSLVGPSGSGKSTLMMITGGLERPSAGRGDAFDRARAGLIAVGLEERVLHYPSQLSGGEQQRVALARAFAASPKLLLADEPTGNLDTATGRRVIDLLFELSAMHGTTLLLITHDRDLARQCHRIVHMADGRIVEAPEQAGAASGAARLGVR